MTNLLTIPKAAQILAVSRWTIYKYINDGLLFPVKLPSGRMRIPVAELRRFIVKLKKDTKNVRWHDPEALEWKRTIERVEHWERTGEFLPIKQK